MTTASARRRRFALIGALAVAPLAFGAGAGADEDFIAGSGRARASLFEVLPRTGGLTIPVSFGRALASYQGTRAEASSIAVKPPSGPPPGAPVAECGEAPDAPGGGGGGDAPGLSFPFSSNLAVDSDDEGAEAGRHATLAAIPADSPVQGTLQQQDVSARRDPMGEAATTSGRLALTDVIELTGGAADAKAGVVDGQTRLAQAVVTLARLSVLADAVVLEDLRWMATQRTGEGEGAEAEFTVGRVTVGGTPVPVAPPGGADPVAVANTALAPTGLAFDPPRVEQADGVARVTPLSLRLADSPLGRDALGPVLGGAQPVRDPLVEQLLALSCDFGAAVTVADVVLSMGSGSGGVSFDVGGVSATTEGTRFDNPFDGPLDLGFPGLELPSGDTGLPVTLPPAPDLLTPPPLTEGTGAAFPDLAYGNAPAFGATTPAPGGDEVAAPGPDPVASFQPALGPTTRQLAGRRGGTALAIGLLGLAAVLCVAGADALRIRRAARTIT